MVLWSLLVGVSLASSSGASDCKLPGRLSIFWTLSTGLGMPKLQKCIDQVEKQAIRKEKFTERDKRFLTDFYRTLAFGGKALIFLRQSGRLMTHYLNKKGTDYVLHHRIFVKSDKVQKKMKTLRSKVRRNGCIEGKTYKSNRFDMTDRSHWDAHVGLYYGTIQVTSSRDKKGRCQLQWYAQVPWVWPTYKALNLRIDNFSNKKRFLVPTIRGLASKNNKYNLYVSDGLGAHLVTLDLAETFLSYAKWKETMAEE